MAKQRYQSVCKGEFNFWFGNGSARFFQHNQIIIFSCLITNSQSLLYCISLHLIKKKKKSTSGDEICQQAGTKTFTSKWGLLANIVCRLYLIPVESFNLRKFQLPILVPMKCQCLVSELLKVTSPHRVLKWIGIVLVYQFKVLPHRTASGSLHACGMHASCFTDASWINK